MRLVELSPRWLKHPNGRILLFKSPSGHGDWLTCKDFVIKIHDQLVFLYDNCPDLVGQTIVGCNKDMCWKIVGEDFNTLTVTPSLDASKSGNWHGFITNGEIR